MGASGGHGGLEQQLVLPENIFSWDNRPQMSFLKIVRRGGSLGSTAHPGAVDAVIQRQLEKFAPTQQTGGDIPRELLKEVRAWRKSRMTEQAARRARLAATSFTLFNP